MKLIIEEWRSYLTEVTFETAKEVLDSKRTLKIIKGYRYDKGQEDPDYLGGADDIQSQHRNFKNYLLDVVPNDLTDNQKGTAVLWLIKLSRENPKTADRFINGRVFSNRLYTPTYRSTIETFFHNPRFMPQRDLMQVKSMEDLIAMTNTAKEEIQKAQEKKSYLDADEGTTVLRDDADWKIAEVHNKGAACELGKGTDWCTAAPGLDYFEQYYEKGDPLFYFQNKKNLNKFQFQYGSEQFMDSDDEPVEDDDFIVLHNLLKQTDAYGKYEVIKYHDLGIVSKEPDVSIDELRTMINSLSQGSEQLAIELVTDAVFDTEERTPDHVINWLASEEFHEYAAIAKHLVRRPKLVPTEALEDIAQNNPHEEIRKKAEEEVNKRKNLSELSSLQESFSRYL